MNNGTTLFIAKVRLGSLKMDSIPAPVMATEVMMFS